VLSSVVEHTTLGVEDDLLKGLGGELGVLDEVVQVVDISLVVLTVVEAEGVGGDEARESIRGEGKGRKGERHILREGIKRVRVGGG
jgi:hypothetical protein